MEGKMFAYGRDRMFEGEEVVRGNKSSEKKGMAGRKNRGESGNDGAGLRGPANQQEECTMLIQKILVTASLGGLLSIGTPGMLLGQQPKPQPGKPSQPSQPGQKRQQRATQSISGKVTDIGGHSFTLETDTGGSMQFVVDKNTQVLGQVKVGMLVAVDYQATEDGQLLCVRVAPQNG